MINCRKISSCKLKIQILLLRQLIYSKLILILEHEYTPKQKITNIFSVFSQHKRIWNDLIHLLKMDLSVLYLLLVWVVDGFFGLSQFNNLFRHRREVDYLPHFGKL